MLKKAATFIELSKSGNLYLIVKGQGMMGYIKLENGEVPELLKDKEDADKAHQKKIKEEAKQRAEAEKLNQELQAAESKLKAEFEQKKQSIFSKIIGGK